MKLDETLASNITDLIRNGMNEEQCLMFLSKMKIMQDQTIVKVLKLWKQITLCGILYPQKQEPMKEKCKA